MEEKKISELAQKSLNYIETKELSKTELINFFNNINNSVKITSYEKEVLTEAVEKKIRIKFPKSAKKVLGGKSAKAQELLQEIYSLLIKEFDWSNNCVGNKVKVSGRMIGGKEYVGWYISYKNDDGYSTGFGYRQITVEEDPYLEIDYRRVGKKYENEREVKIFPVELKEEALNLYKNFLVKTIK
jgi:hypothetical protein